MNLSQKNWIVLILLALAFIGIAISNSRTQIRITKNCSENQYVKIGDHIFYIPKTTSGVFKDGELISQVCNNTKETPIEADEFSFIGDIKLNKYPETYRIQFLLKTGLEEEIRKGFLKYKDLLERTSRKELMKDGKFYAYYYKDVPMHYVPADKSKETFVLSNCTPQETIFSCNLSTLWKPDISLHISLNPTKDVVVPDEKSVTMWEKAYSQYIKALENYYVGQWP